MQANAVALAQEQTKRLAAMKEKQDVEGRDNGRSNHLLGGGAVGGRVRPADGMEILGQGMFSTLVHMHGNDDHGAKREGSSSVNAKSSASAVRSAEIVAKSSKLADAIEANEEEHHLLHPRKYPGWPRCQAKSRHRLVPIRLALLGRRISDLKEPSRRESDPSFDFDPCKIFVRINFNILM